MNTNGRALEPPDLGSFSENRNKYPPELLIPIEGRHVAWTPDGTRILASGETMEAVEGILIAAGINPNQVVFGYIDPS